MAPGDVRACTPAAPGAHKRTLRPRWASTPGRSGDRIPQSTPIPEIPTSPSSGANEETAPPLAARKPAPMAPEAFRGPFGTAAELFAESCEASRENLLAQTLVGVFGNTGARGCCDWPRSRRRLRAAGVDRRPERACAQGYGVEFCGAATGRGVPRFCTRRRRRRGSAHGAGAVAGAARPELRRRASL